MKRGGIMLNIEELLSDIISRVSIETGKDLSFEIINHRDGVYSEVYKIDTIEKSKMYNKEIGEYEIYSIPSPMDLDGSIRDEKSGIFTLVTITA